MASQKPVAKIKNDLSIPLDQHFPKFILDMSARQIDIIAELIQSVVESVEESQFELACLLSFTDCFNKNDYRWIICDANDEHVLDLQQWIKFLSIGSLKFHIFYSISTQAGHLPAGGITAFIKPARQ